MNIFYLDKNPKVAARMHNNKHVVKMILETAQLLSTAHRVLDGEQYIDASSGRRIKRWKINSPEVDAALYKATHINHPSAKWVRESNSNYNWLFNLFISLLDEYTYRYGKHHKCEFLKPYLHKSPKNILISELTDMPQCMPEYCQVPGDSILAYRQYYLKEKTNMLIYTKRNKPEWIQENKG